MRRITLGGRFRRETKPDFEDDVTEINSLSSSVESLEVQQLRSALKTSTASRTRIAPSRRRIRWETEHEDPFADLNDSLLSHIFGYLDVLDVTRASGVCQRFCSVGVLSSHRTLNVSSWVQQVYGKTKSALTTSALLQKKLEGCKPQVLVLEDVGEALWPDTFLPSLIGLKELRIRGWKLLSDTHVHVCLLSTGKKCQLQKLALENCPELTNACLRSIATNCPQLRELSLQGCPQINDLTHLKTAWKVQAPLLPDVLSLSSVPTLTPSLQSMFQRPPVMQPAASSSPLTSLFAPLGTSPKTEKRVSFHAAPEGKLSHLNVSETAVTPKSFVASLQQVESGKVQLESLIFRDADWKDSHWRTLRNLLSLDAFHYLDIGSSTSSALSDAPLDRLTSVEYLAVSACPLLLAKVLTSAENLKVLKSSCPVRTHEEVLVLGHALEQASHLRALYLPIPSPEHQTALDGHCTNIHCMRVY